MMILLPPRQAKQQGTVQRHYKAQEEVLIYMVPPASGEQMIVPIMSLVFRVMGRTTS
jgi:hypothetical protein